MEHNIENILAELKKKLPFITGNGGKIVNLSLEGEDVVIVYDNQETMKLRQQNFLAMVNYAQSS